MDRVDILTEYKRYLKVRGIRTRKDYLSSVIHFFQWCDTQNLFFSVLTHENVITWRRWLMEEGLSWATVNNKVNRVRCFYRYLVFSGLVLDNPFDRLKGLKTSQRLPRNIIKPEDYEHLVSSFSIMRTHDVMLLTLIELLYGSALRISEALSLKEQDVDRSSGVITITEHKKDRMRKLPVTEAALVSLGRYSKTVRTELLNESELSVGFLFPHRGSTSIRCLLNRKLKSECERLGYQVLTSHSFRHSAATSMLKNGAGLRHVQDFLGHSRISTTQRYTHLISDDLRKVIDGCHPREIRS